MARVWKTCVTCGGRKKIPHPQHSHVMQNCLSCNGRGGMYITEPDDGCAIAMLCILGSAMVSSCAVGYGIIKAIL